MATSSPEHREPKPSVLSQLLAAQSMLHVLPTPERIGQFISHALKSSLPDCVSGVCFGGQAGLTGDFDACPHTNCSAAEESAAGLPHCNCCLAADKGARDFPLATLDRFYGHLLVKMQDPEELALYEPFLTNLANAISLTLENKWQR